MNSRYYRFRSRLFGSVPLLISAFMFSAQHVNAQTGDEGDDAPTINIAGDVYGGGKQGSVGIGNLDASLKYTAEEAQEENAKTEHLANDPAGRKPGDDGYVTTYKAGYTPVSAGDAKPVSKDDVNLTTDAINAMYAANPSHTTSVEINDGHVRTVFGGGENGRVYGLSTAFINGGEIGAENLTGTIHGGVFGAGDGASAYVFGESHVWIKGGTIYNNVYGGGNQADLIGSAFTRLDAGNIYGNVFGSARMADTYGYTNIVIGYDDASADKTKPLYVKAVYGGNDIAGESARTMDAMTHILAGAWNFFSSAPAFIGKATVAYADRPEWKPYDEQTITYSYSPVPKQVNVNGAINMSDITNHIVMSQHIPGKSMFVGNLFAGGNGDYDYKADDVQGQVKLIDELNDDGITPKSYKIFGSADNPLSKPDAKKAYLQLEGGTFGYVYGGGNNATITASTDIYINNPEAPCDVPAEIMEKMDIQKTSYDIVTGTDSKQYARFPQTFDRVFGGNNLATMDIAPNWYLHEGRINNLYGGGNKGAMTCPDGILVNVFQNKDYVYTNNGKTPVKVDETSDEYQVDNTKPKNRVKINNLYGGCRMADVNPRTPTEEDKTANPNIGKKLTEGFLLYASNSLEGEERAERTAPKEYAARVYISGGNINNVYGGNDISGKVYYGTDVEINGAISGDVYGGGNGAYPYTDNKELAEKHPDEWGDYYYAADGTLTGTECTASNSLDGLNAKRPHVEKTLVHIYGEGMWRDPSQTYTYKTYKIHNTAAEGEPQHLVEEWVTETKAGNGEMEDINRVYVTGGVYCGGNSATLKSSTGNATSTLKIGRCVTIDKVFLGSNGERMVDEGLLTMYAKGITYTGDTYATADTKVTTTSGNNYVLAKFDLTNSVDMTKYMEGCAVDIKPNILYDFQDTEYNVSQAGHEDADKDPEGLNYSAHIGSFFFGGNVGSMTADGAFDQNFLSLPREMVVYNKVVGGCNNANVPFRAGINAFYQGGVTGTPGPTDFAKQADGTTPIPNVKLQFYVPCRMQPMYLDYVRDDAGFIVWPDNESAWSAAKTADPSLSAANTPREKWNTEFVISDHGVESDVVGPVTILKGGNIYGGCYQSGYVNGTIQIDIMDELCSTPQMRERFGDKEFISHDKDNFNEGTAAVVDNMRRYVLSHGWSVFGGGYGKETEVWGDVYINLGRAAGYINCYGGGEEGFIGKIERYGDEAKDGKTETIKKVQLDDDGKIVLGGDDGKTPQYVTETVTKYPGDYKTVNAQYTVTTTTTTTTTPKTESLTYDFNKYVVAEGGAHDTYVNMRHDIKFSPISIFGLNGLYGGGFKGIVTGNTHVYAGGGLHYDVFGGACNADIYGATEVFVGQDREGRFSNNLTLRHCVYGGNDFGGQILGTMNHTVTVKGAKTISDDGQTMSAKTEEKTVTSNTYVKYMGGTIERALFGGSCGLYRYTESYTWQETDGDFFYLNGEKQTATPGATYRMYPNGSWDVMPTLFTEITPQTIGTTTATEAYNTFVDIDCQSNNAGNNVASNIYGGGYGFCDQSGRVDANTTYVLLHSLENGSVRIAENVFGGGYFSYTKNSLVDAVSGRVQGIYGGTYGTTVDENVAKALKAEQQALAARIASEDYGFKPGDDGYKILSELQIFPLSVADYTSEQTEVNVYPTLHAYTDMEVFGAGAYTGANSTKVNLFGGTVKDVYGGSNKEGVCTNAIVNIPKGSGISMDAVYGGSKGSVLALPCDVKHTFVNFYSDDAIVKAGNVYGGNNAYRASRFTNVEYHAKAKDSKGQYLNIFGAGNGENTVSGRTKVNIGATARVLNVYGGGNEGSVFYKYDVLKDEGVPDKPEEPAEGATAEQRNAYNEAKTAYDAAIAAGKHDASNYLRYTIHEENHAGNSYAHWYDTEDTETVNIGTEETPDNVTRPVKHTSVFLAKGAKVDGSVCGAGFGDKSDVAGFTYVECNGAIIDGDIFGGGYNGNVRKMVKSDTGYKDEDREHLATDTDDPYYNNNLYVSTQIDMNGGTVRNIFGGGYAGYVGETNVPAKTTLATGEALLAEGSDYLTAEDYTSRTTINLGTSAESPTLFAGRPVVNNSVYGAGDRGPVYGSSVVNMYNGDVGYNVTYNEDGTVKELTERLKASESDETETLKEDGNVYGGGFGEDARVLTSTVTMYNGRIRNSLYGGGELSAIGWGTVIKNEGTGEISLDAIQKPGKTNVYMYGGLVQNDVFGGGRGYCYNNFGIMEYGTKFNTDGVVFGKTDVDIFRGTVGTDQSILEENGSHGNVFGGGNVGYVFSAQKKLTAAEYEAIPSENVNKAQNVVREGYYYMTESDPDKTALELAGTRYAVDELGYMILSEDVRVSVKAYGMATANITNLPPYTLSYERGQKVAEEYVGLLSSHIVNGVTDEEIVTEVDGHTWTENEGDYTVKDVDNIKETLYFGGKTNPRIKAVITYRPGDVVKKPHTHAADEPIGDNDCLNFLSNFTIDNILTRDASVTISGSYAKGDYIPNEQLNMITNTNASWGSIDDSGIVIRNAVFAGGNVSKGSDRVYAYSKTVYANATAAIVDVYSRDLISVAGNGYGGLYGDGNLTFVDGYRELNITNYGTDFYVLDETVQPAQLANLTSRQQGFYTTKYKCTTTDAGYSVGEVIMKDLYDILLDAGSINAGCWAQQASMVNQGRYLNTIQRADYCGISGSRLVLNGEVDRAQGATEADYTKYTVNRVGEISFNRRFGQGENAATTPVEGEAAAATQSRTVHGSYFGIYNVVKYLGALSSDYDFYAGLTGEPSRRETSSTDAKMKADITHDWRNNTTSGTPETITIPYGTEKYSFFNWKAEHAHDDLRNNGTVLNKIALASGVYLELVRDPDGADANETLTEAGKKDYGPVIGVLELDLLNVAPGEGGGYVYAENNHGMPSFSTQASYAAILSDANQGLKTVRGYTYTPLAGTTEAESGKITNYNGIVTSGNFVNSLKTIIDDCYPVADDLKEEAHYWYIKGNTYVYEQLISAYTGSANKYFSDLNIPLDLNGKLNAKLRLVDVLPGLYANPGTNLNVDIANTTRTFTANDPISFWDWHNLPSATIQNQFATKTYTAHKDVKVTVSATSGEGTTTKVYHEGDALTAAEYAAIQMKNSDDTDMKAVYEDGTPIYKPDGTTQMTVKECFTITNEVSRDKGYLLTLDLDNPNVWDKYYTSISGATSITKDEWDKKTDAQKADYIEAATFKCVAAGTYGQAYYNVGDIISESTYAAQDALGEHAPASQAQFKAAYIAKVDCKVGDTNYQKGASISEDTYTGMSDDDKGHFEKAYVCVNTFSISEREYRVLNQLIGKTEFDSYAGTAYAGKNYQSNFSEAYYCKAAGSWGGKYYEADKNYNGVDYCSVLPDERSHFTYNYDALDLLCTDYDPYKTIAETDEAMTTLLNTLRNAGLTKSAHMGEYGSEARKNLYASDQPLDFEAVARTEGTNKLPETVTTYTFPEGECTSVNNLTSAQFNALPNECKYYSSFTLTDAANKVAENQYEVYIVKPGCAFTTGEILYNVGKAINPAEFDNLTEAQQANFTKVQLTSPGTYYYCNEQYTLGEKNGVVPEVNSPSFKSEAYTKDGSAMPATEYTSGIVPVGTIMSSATMASTVNYQKYYTLTGKSPVEQATLYVPASADINALLKDRYVTAVYEYEYTEGDAEGKSYETKVEKHIINIRLKFESDQPEIGPIAPPDIILPYIERLSIPNPYVIPGAFDVITGGWEIYLNEYEAKRHNNGRKFDNGIEPSYFYQDGNWVAYYAETRLGRTYSKPVQIAVANYHRLSDLLNAVTTKTTVVTETTTGEHSHDYTVTTTTTVPNFMYIDNKACKRNPKIYIDSRNFDYTTYTPGTEVVDENGNKTITPTSSTDANKSELEALKILFELSTATATWNAGESYERRNVQNCAGLEFYIQSDIDMTDKVWQKIGDGTNCFSGNIHGNGHTITNFGSTKDKYGLPVAQSTPVTALFGKICGNVYNLGVQGSFTGAGIADNGGGNNRVENCWVWTNAKTAGENPQPVDLTSVNAVVGDNEAGILNCYYPSINNFKTGKAQPRTVDEFLNGQVAYDLNRFYLEARYAKETYQSTDGSMSNNAYLRQADDASGKPVLETTTTTDDKTLKKVYPLAYATEFTNRYGSLGYVEAYYADGDFRYAQGLKPKTNDLRYAMDNGSSTQAFVPIYPDDYIFFGQKLSYNLYEGASYKHDLHPTVIDKEFSKEDTNAEGGVDNSRNGLLTYDDRLYRAPAYYQNGTYGESAIFNREIALRDHIRVMDFTVDDTQAQAQEGGDPDATKEVPVTKNDILDTDGYVPVTTVYNGSTDEDIAGVPPYYPHRNMTAIDFTGGNGDMAGGYTRTGKYGPLLDVEDIQNIKTDGLTQNLLFYLPKALGNYNPNVRDWLNGDDKLPYEETDTTYRTVGIADGSSIHGHVVIPGSTAGSYIAVVDHFLVDKQDFNAPITYTFNAGKRMWYQRKPDDTRYATDMKNGWDDVCLPFAVEMVTTQTKGEITHFYNSDDDKVSHEYWLREFSGNVDEDEDDENTVYAKLILPTPPKESPGKKKYKNTFLYDYYYSKDEFQDKNKDLYQKTYYSTPHEYTDYAYQNAGKPYIVGFPGKTYYEFDLSGQWTPANRIDDGQISSPGAQYITFVGPAGGTVTKSDNEAEIAHAVSGGGYDFVPTYLAKEYDATSEGGSYYEMNTLGTAFDIVTKSVFKSVPFRPFFRATPSSGAKEVTRSIVFGMDDKEIEENPFDDRKGVDETNSMKIYVRGHKLVIESTYDATLNVYYINGQFVRKVDVKEGTNTYDGFRPGFYIVGNKKVNFAPGNY